MRSEFNNGIVYAAARVIETHDCPVIAFEIIKSSGLTHDDLKCCSEYDLAFLRKSDASIPKGVV